jgi:large subunit ribosomal protein L10
MSTRTERDAVIETLEKQFSEATGIYLTDFNKIDVEKITKFRSDLRANNTQYIVVKNTLAKIALERSGMRELKEYFTGPVGVAITRDEATAPARVIRDFKKEFKDLLGVKAAYVEGAVVQADKVAELANLPTREVQLSQLLSCFKAPIGAFAGSLNAILTEFAGVIEALKNKRESE